MEGEISNFIKAWTSILVCLCYCYVVGKVVGKGIGRLATVVPVVCLFLTLPLALHSVHLVGLTAFFISWLANFKLLMFAFAIGPLSDPSLSLLRFIAIACFPIKIRHNPQPNATQTHKSPFNYATKALLLVLMMRVYDYGQHIPQMVIWFLYSFHIYFALEIILAALAVLGRALLGAELEPQFNEPYLSTSLQDFWGRRWNIMVSRILRPTVYDPTLRFSARVLGREWAPIPAILSTFAVSAAMHELIFYYLGRTRPTWIITCFFVLHGVCLTAEIAAKKALAGRWWLPPAFSRPLTVSFLMATGLWLFLPELLRFNADQRAFEEYAAVGAFVKDVGLLLTFKSFNTTAAI